MTIQGDWSNNGPKGRKKISEIVGKYKVYIHILSNVMTCIDLDVDLPLGQL